MKKRPLILTILALMHLAYPFFYLIQVVWFGKVPIENVMSLIPVIYNPLKHPHFFYISVVSLVIGYGLFRVWVWAFYLFLVNAVYSVVHNFYVLFFMYGFSDDPFKGILRIVGILASLGVVGYFIRKEIRAPYFNPRMRWWESAPRYVVNIPVSFKGHASSDDAKIYDLAIGGAFVVTKGEFKLGEYHDCTFTLNETDNVDVKGEVVWVSDGTGRHPQGVGVKFQGVTKDQERSINTFFKNADFERADR